jgi:hypothetical protein
MREIASNAGVSIETVIEFPVQGARLQRGPEHPGGGRRSTDPASRTSGVPRRREQQLRLPDLGWTGDTTAWNFRLEPTATGTRLTQAYQIVTMPAWQSVTVSVLISAHGDPPPHSGKTCSASRRWRGRSRCRGGPHSRYRSGRPLVEDSALSNATTCVSSVREPKSTVGSNS